MSLSSSIQFYNKNMLKRNIFKNNSNTKLVCLNCGKIGHLFRYCTESVSSYGIIAIKLINKISINQLCNDSLYVLPSSINYNSSNLQVLLIRRKDSLTFIEFIRGKYDLMNMQYVKELFLGMTQSEHELIKRDTFEDLWKYIWGDEIISDKHSLDFDKSKKLFNTLFSTVEQKDKILSEWKTEWTEPEWGFPKGRRNVFETDIDCAIREFYEETNIPYNDITFIQNIKPISEVFTGSNGIHYKHIYYMALCNSSLICNGISNDNIHMKREIGDIGWFTIDEAMKKIRRTSTEKRELLLKIQKIFNTFHII